jgi:hypothetical protein
LYFIFKSPSGAATTDSTDTTGPGGSIALTPEQKEAKRLKDEQDALLAKTKKDEEDARKAVKCDTLKYKRDPSHPKFELLEYPELEGNFNSFRGKALQRGHSEDSALKVATFLRGMDLKLDLDIFDKYELAWDDFKENGKFNLASAPSFREALQRQKYEPKSLVCKKLLGFM